MLHLEVIVICLSEAYFLHAHIEEGHPIEYIEGDCEDHQGRVGAQRDPPEQLLVQLLLEVLQHEQTNGESSHSSSQVGNI